MGHNILMFDLPQLRALHAGLGLLDMPALDTLHLNPLAFPAHPYHRLVKHYRDGGLIRTTHNDPLLDSQLTLQVLEAQLTQLRENTSPELLSVWHWLTAHEAGPAFDAFFTEVRQRPVPTPEQGREELWRFLVEKACRTAARELTATAEDSAWPAAYVTAWMSTAGTNSAIPPWVLQHHPDTAALARRLREEICTDGGHGGRRRGEREAGVRVEPARRGQRGLSQRDDGEHHRRRRPGGDGQLRRGDTYTAAEGSTATVTVTLSADPERTVEVPITTTNQGGATSADYSGVPASVTFDAGDTSKTFDFAATADTEDDDGESVRLGFGSSLPVGVSQGTPAETTVSITDDDPQVTVSFGAATYTAAEGGTATVTVTLSADPERTVAIPLTKTNQGGATAADYSGVPVTVTFDAGDTSKTFTFTAAQDTADDDGESILLGFGTLPGGITATTGQAAATTVSIRDDDDPQVTVSFGASTYTAAEGGTATVTVTLSADPERTVEVRITTTNQGGASAADYSGVPASVTFDAGDTSKTFDFAATADTEDDDGESVELGFGSSLPVGVSEGSPSETTVSITDDDSSVTLTVAVAHTTGRHLDQHFPLPRWVQVHLFHPQRLVLGVKDCCFHFLAPLARYV